MKRTILMLMYFVISVKSENETENWTPIGSPLITSFPCESRDIVTWFDPSLPPREKNRYYVYIHKTLPENSKVSLSFDTEVTITLTFRVGEKNYVRWKFDKGNYFMLRPFQKFSGFGFIVKGAIPGVIPYFTSIDINGEQQCYRPYVDYLDQYVAETSNSGPQKHCGVRKVKLITSASSRATRLGEWPWHTAIYRLDESGFKYICGGTLISKNFVLTAAHCASLRGNPLLPEALTVILGKYNLKRENIGEQQREVLKIIIHERFEYRHLHNDIALLRLKYEAVFNKYVQPICLWCSEAAEKIKSDDILGTVVGWSLKNTGKLSKHLRKVRLPMVSENTCVQSNFLFYAEILKDSSKFCAGYHNGTTICNGDSGSSFQIFVPHGEQDPKARRGSWYLRGIVSLTASRLDAPLCDPNEYVVFTNIKTYRMWIDAYLDNEDY